MGVNLCEIRVFFKVHSVCSLKSGRIIEVTAAVKETRVVAAVRERMGGSALGLYSVSSSRACCLIIGCEG